jgi:hypothetical protein
MAPLKKLPAPSAMLLERVLWLDAEIRADRYPAAARIEERFECSRRSAFNTIRFM